MTTTFDRSFTTRDVPWAKIGTVIDDPAVDAAEAARLGGIDFDVEVTDAAFWVRHRPLLADDDSTQLTDDGGQPLFVGELNRPTTDPGRFKIEPSRRAIIRPDDEEWFSYVSNDYQLVQFREAFAFMDALSPRYVAAGSMTHGRQGFIVVQLPEHERSELVIDDVEDPHDLYVILQTSHDATRGIKIAVTTMRNRCMNMLTLPTFDASAPQSWSIRHVGDPHKQLADAETTLRNTAAYREFFETSVRQLASVRVDSDDLRRIVRRVLPSRLKRVEEQVTAIVDRFETADTVGFRNTGWGALNAISDYLQWGRTTASRTEQSEFTSPLDGDAAKYVNNAFQLLMNSA